MDADIENMSQDELIILAHEVIDRIEKNLHFIVDSAKALSGKSSS